MGIRPTPLNEAGNTNYSGYIKEVTLPTGNKYEIVDYGAREILDTLSNYSKFLGVTQLDINDGSTTSVITIGSGVTTSTVTAVAGDIVLKTVTTTAGMMAREFIFDGTKWQLFGDISTQNLGNLAYKSTATITYTPQVAVSATLGTLTATGYYVPQLTLVNDTATVILSTTSTGTTAAGYLPYTPAGSICAALSSSSVGVLSSVSGAVLVESVSAGGQAASMDSAVCLANVNQNCLMLSWLKYSTADSIADTQTTNMIKSVTSSGSFKGTRVFFSPLKIAIPNSTTASTATIYSKIDNAITNVTHAETQSTLYAT